MSLRDGPVLRLQLRHQFDKRAILGAEKEDFLHFLSANECVNVVKILSRPLRKAVDPLGRNRQERARSPTT